MGNIFERQNDLRPSQLTAVAERRFEDAQALCDTNLNARANGTQYLAGIVIDVLLKAQLMRQYPAIARKRHRELSDDDRRVWTLVWRSHDLGDMLDQLPSVRAGVQKYGEEAGKPYLEWLSGICAAWSIHVRYSTMTSTMDEARVMLSRVRELKEILK
jgi:hypothetical protein